MVFFLAFKFKVKAHVYGNRHTIFGCFIGNLFNPIKPFDWVYRLSRVVITECARQINDFVSLLSGDSPPDRIFTRHSRLAFSEIVSYKSDPSLKWLALTGLIPEVRLIISPDLYSSGQMTGSSNMNIIS